MDNSYLIIANMYIMGSIISEGNQSLLLLFLGFIWITFHLIFSLRREK